VNGTLSSKDDSIKREVELLNRQISHVFQKLSEIERSERQVLGEKKESIKYLAQLFERQQELGAYTEPVNTICAHICKLSRDKYHLFASERWIHEVLGEILDKEGNKKYLQTKFDPTINKSEEDLKEGAREMWQTAGGIEYSLEQPELATDLTDEYAIKRITQKSLDELRDPKEISIATTEEIKKADSLKSMARETAKRADLLKERCARLNIQYQDLDDLENGGTPDTDTIPVVSAISERSGPGLFSAELDELGATIIRAARKVEKYKPDPEMDAQFAECIKRVIKVWRGWVDEKYRKDTISWLHVAMDKQAHGKHAAATMHATILPDGTKRALTREQVGDKDELVLQQAMNVLLMQDDIAAMHSWYVNYPEKAIAKRAKGLHGRLSNSA